MQVNPLRRILSVITAAALAAAFLTGCSGQDEPAPPQEDAVTEADLTAVREELIRTSETEGLGDITAMELYENGVRTASSEYIQAKDNKKLY